MRIDGFKWDDVPALLSCIYIVHFLCMQDDVTQAEHGDLCFDWPTTNQWVGTAGRSCHCDVTQGGSAYITAHHTWCLAAPRIYPEGRKC
jgi:hypothetical protein